MTIENLAKEYTEEAFQKLVELMESDSPKLALEAATEVLDRGWGKSVDRVAIAQVGENRDNPAQLGLDELLQLANGTVLDGELTDD